MAHQLQSAQTLFSTSWRMYVERFPLFVGIYAVPALFSLVFMLFFGPQPEVSTISASILPSFLIYGIVLFVVNILATIALFMASSNRAITVEAAYRSALPLFFSYAWIMILYGLLLIGGFILLLVPGIIFAVWFMFAYTVLIFEGTRGTAALKKSKQYVKGRWFAVFGRMLFLGIIIFIIFSIIATGTAWIFGGFFEAYPSMAGIPSVLLGFLTTPLYIIYTYLLYCDISAVKEETEQVATPVVSEENQVTV